METAGDGDDDADFDFLLLLKSVGGVIVLVVVIGDTKWAKVKGSVNGDGQCQGCYGY